ncbi:uncharacterized protein L199_000308 [Kwoniella botswanensis]|uniref:uncharacterized protein n=1 Tax=Kwoniella botswanensis TaxID=1268659 RepID=UPI00315C53A5
MVQRQSFNDFLNSGSPSTPRGRGRGGFRGGGGRGGRGGGFTPGSTKKSFNADYSNMGFDYEKINSQKYTKMEGFNVQPFGPSSSVSPGPSTARGRGSQTPRGRGRGFSSHHRGGHQQPATPSGVATPVHGLGFHDHESDTRTKGDHRGLGSGKSTVGKGLGTGTVTWGGGKAPLFVKAGELFKNGEADVITMGEDHKLHVEVYPMSDPSAPQMTHLQDETEIDFIQQPSPLSPPTSSPPSSLNDESPLTVQGEEGLHNYQDEALEELLSSATRSLAVDNDPASHGIPISQNPSIPVAHIDEYSETIAIKSTSPEREDVIVIEETEVIVPMAEGGPIDAVESKSVEDETPLFFIDTNPEADDETPPIPTYDIIESRPLGEQTTHVQAEESEEEKILFVPKTYKKPAPIFIDIGASSHSQHRSPAPEIVSRAFVNPQALSRAEKKAAKREKRRGRGKKSRQRKQDKMPREDSDIEWGSDGPPVNIIDVQGGESDSFVDPEDAENEEDEDIKLLRDYMKGTMLNAETDMDEQEGEVEMKVREEELDAQDDEDAEEMDIEAMKMFGQGIKGLTEGGQEIVDEDDWQSDDSREAFEEEEEEDDDDDDEDDSSVLGEIDIEGMMDDDSEDEDVEALFNGSSQWDKDTDWFINAMEDALDGTDVNMKDRKSRNSLFKSIEDGDFGDNWGLTPAKKSKKNKFVPPELQVQWEKDRLVKAEKKQQRELERLIAEIEPTLAGYSRKGKAKAKGKGKAHQAAVAHLIPASASQVADLFDISSDEEGDFPLPLFRKGGRIPTSMPLEMVDERIQIFLDDRGKTTLQLPPMGKDDRKKVHMLADCYNLGSKSRGSGKTRFTVLTKNKRSGTLVDEIKIERLLTASQKVGGSFYKALYTRGGKAKVKGQSSGPSIRHKEGDMVGHGADKIGQDNIGHRLLSKMGWAEGDRIGRGAGLEAPIVAIVKNTKTGLGA